MAFWSLAFSSHWARRRSRKRQIDLLPLRCEFAGDRSSEVAGESLHFRADLPALKLGDFDLVAGHVRCRIRIGPATDADKGRRAWELALDRLDREAGPVAADLVEGERDGGA